MQQIESLKSGERRWDIEQQKADDAAKKAEAQRKLDADKLAQREEADRRRSVLSASFNARRLSLTGNEILDAMLRAGATPEEIAREKQNLMIPHVQAYQKEQAENQPKIADYQKKVSDYQQALAQKVAPQIGVQAMTGMLGAMGVSPLMPGIVQPPVAPKGMPPPPGPPPDVSPPPTEDEVLNQPHMSMADVLKARAQARADRDLVRREAADKAKEAYQRATIERLNALAALQQKKWEQQYGLAQSKLSLEKTRVGISQMDANTRRMNAVTAAAAQVSLAALRRAQIAQGPERRAMLNKWGAIERKLYSDRETNKKQKIAFENSLEPIKAQLASHGIDPSNPPKDYKSAVEGLKKAKGTDAEPDAKLVEQVLELSAKLRTANFTMSGFDAMDLDYDAQLRDARLQQQSIGGAKTYDTGKTATDRSGAKSRFYSKANIR